MPPTVLSQASADQGSQFALLVVPRGQQVQLLGKGSVVGHLGELTTSIALVQLVAHGGRARELGRGRAQSHGADSNRSGNEGEGVRSCLGIS